MKYPNTKTEISSTRPEFIRLPKNGTRETWTGLSRSALNALVLPAPTNGYKPPVASRVLRERGRLRGIRLIVLDSLIEYLHAQPAEAPSENE